MKVFVYGTLKKGGALFLGEYAQDIHKAEIKGVLYQTYGCWFPFADVTGDGIIKGEVHEYPAELIPHIDRIENMYQRREVTTTDGEVVQVYHYDKIDEDFTPVEGGEWALTMGAY